MFLTRVVELLQGLGSKLGVRVNFMDIMAQYAKDALIGQHPVAASVPLFYPTPALSFLDRKVRRLLQEMADAGEVSEVQTEPGYTGGRNGATIVAWRRG